MSMPMRTVYVFQALGRTPFMCNCKGRTKHEASRVLMLDILEICPKRERERGREGQWQISLPEWHWNFAVKYQIGKKHPPSQVCTASSYLTILNHNDARMTRRILWPSMVRVRPFYSHAVTLHTGNQGRNLYHNVTIHVHNSLFAPNLPYPWVGQFVLK